jgi:hypothetical protein
MTHLTQVAVQDGEILQIVTLDDQARLTEQAILDVLSLGVQLVQQHVRIDALRCRKEDHLHTEQQQRRGQGLAGGGSTPTATHLKTLRDRLEEVIQIGTLSHVDLMNRTVESTATTTI